MVFWRLLLIDINDPIWRELNEIFQVEINGSQVEYSLVEIWVNDIKELKKYRKDIKFLKEYKYIIYTEKDVWEHLNTIKNSPKRVGGTNINHIGGHTSQNFIRINSAADSNNPVQGKWLIFDKNIPGLPPEMQTYSSSTFGSGHIEHKHLFYEVPLSTPNGIPFNGKMLSMLALKLK